MFLQAVGKYRIAQISWVRGRTREVCRQTHRGAAGVAEADWASEPLSSGLTRADAIAQQSFIQFLAFQVIFGHTPWKRDILVIS